MFFFPISDENPTKKKPLISWFIISICIFFFLKYVFEDNYIKEQIFISFGMIPALLFGFSDLSPPLKIIHPFLTILTSMFIHGGWMHLIGNMTLSLYFW